MRLSFTDLLEISHSSACCQTIVTMPYLLNTRSSKPTKAYRVTLNPITDSEGTFFGYFDGTTVHRRRCAFEEGLRGTTSQCFNTAGTICASLSLEHRIEIEIQKVQRPCSIRAGSNLRLNEPYIALNDGRNQDKTWVYTIHQNYNLKVTTRGN